jgi:hypothetical protein
MSFSAITGAKYLPQLITVLQDFFGDVKKVLVAVGILFFGVKGVQAIAGSDSQGFIVTLFHTLFIIAVVGAVVTILVAVGGATLDENILKELQTKTVTVEKNTEVLYEIE